MVSVCCSADRMRRVLMRTRPRSINEKCDWDVSFCRRVAILLGSEM